MPLPKNTRYRVRTYPSGKRVRLAISPGGRVIETKTMRKIKQTKSRKRLTRKRRRIGL